MYIYIVRTDLRLKETSYASDTMKVDISGRNLEFIE
jgi:hypothetical protein